MSTQAGYISTNTPYIPGGHSVFPLTMMFFPPFNHIIYLLTNCQLTEACCSSTHTHTHCVASSLVYNLTHILTHTHTNVTICPLLLKHTSTQTVYVHLKTIVHSHTLSPDTHTLLSTSRPLSLSLSLYITLYIQSQIVESLTRPASTNTYHHTAPACIHTHSHTHTDKHSVPIHSDSPCIYSQTLPLTHSLTHTHALRFSVAPTAALGL